MFSAFFFVQKTQLTVFQSFGGIMHNWMKKPNDINQSMAKKREKILLLYLLPSLIGLLIFYVIPYVAMFWYSVLDNPIQKHYVGLKNYLRLLQNRSFLIAFGNMTVLSGGGIIIILPLSLGIAVLLQENNFLSKIVRSSILLPLFVPAVCVIMVWRILFDRQGTVNDLLSAIGGRPVVWLKTGWGRLAILVMYLWKNTGLNVVMFIGALAAVPFEQIEVARLEGAGRWQIFRKVILRNILPSIVFASVVSLISSYKLFREVYLLTSNYPQEELYLLSHFLNNMLRKMEYGKLSAASVLYALATAAVMAVLFWIDKKKEKDIQ